MGIAYMLMRQPDDPGTDPKDPIRESIRTLDIAAAWLIIGGILATALIVAGRRWGVIP